MDQYFHLIIKQGKNRVWPFKKNKTPIYEENLEN